MSRKIEGVTRVSRGLASYVVRSGNRYFDFRSMDDLLKKSDRLVGKKENFFRKIKTPDRKYLDALSAIRNYVVHDGEAAKESYKRHLSAAYGVKSAPDADEFLNSLDKRKTSPARNKKRLNGLAVVVKRCISAT